MARILITLALLLMTGCHAAVNESYIQADQLQGIESLARTTHGLRVTPKPAMRTGVPKEGYIDLEPGDASTFGDGHHVSVRIRYVGTKHDRYLFDVTTSNRPPNQEVTTTVSHVSVQAYSNH